MEGICMMIGLARHALAIVEEEQQKALSVLSLQKVLYFSIGQYIKENGIDSFIESIYSSPFEAWDYGPVNREIYRQHRYEGLPAERNDEDYMRLNDYILLHAQRNPFEMVEDSHKKPFWSSKKSEILNREGCFEYNLEDLKNDFA